MKGFEVMGMLFVNKLQMFQRANGKVYFKLYTMDPAKGRYNRTAIHKIILIKVGEWNFRKLLR